MRPKLQIVDPTFQREMFPKISSHQLIVLVLFGLGLTSLWSSHSYLKSTLKHNDIEKDAELNHYLRMSNSPLIEDLENADDAFVKSYNKHYPYRSFDEPVEPYNGDLLNVVILYPDDWRHDDIGGLAPVVRTPFLNRLAQQGIHFTYNAVTTSICWVSRATLFTGQYVSRHASTYLFRPAFAMSAWNTTWPYLLQQKGYYVGHIGKWQYLDFDGYKKKIFNWTSYHEGEHWYPRDVKGEWKDIAAADAARDDTFRFLRERPKDKPFALTVAFYPPKAVGSHLEPGLQWRPTNETKKIYENETIPLPYNMTEAFYNLPEFLQDEHNMGRERWTQRWRTDEHYQTGMKNYYALISHVDKVCEQIVDQLKRDHLYNNTMIIFTTDNGLFHGAHGLAGKWYPYQESIRVPLIIYDPRMPHHKRGTRDESLTLNVDLAETILGAANITPLPLMQGRDISDLYLQSTEHLEQSPWRSEFYYEYPIGTGLPKDPKSTALVRKDWKYIHFPEKDFDQLFNLVEDPLEMNDLATNITEENLVRLNEMKIRHKELKYKVMEPIIPGSECDPLRAPGSQIPENAPACYEMTELEKMIFELKKVGRRIYYRMLNGMLNGVCSGTWQTRIGCKLLYDLVKISKRSLSA